MIRYRQLDSVEGGEEAVWKSLPALESRVESSEGGTATPGRGSGWARGGGCGPKQAERRRQPSSGSVKHQPVCTRRVSCW